MCTPYLVWKESKEWGATTPLRPSSLYSDHHKHQSIVSIDIATLLRKYFYFYSFHSCYLTCCFYFVVLWSKDCAVFLQYCNCSLYFDFQNYFCISHITFLPHLALRCTFYFAFKIPFLIGFNVVLELRRFAQKSSCAFETAKCHSHSTKAL